MIEKLRKHILNWLFPTKDKTFDEKLIEDINSKLIKLKVDIEDIQENKDLLASAHRVLQEPSFNYVINKLISIQIEHSVKEADSWQRVLFDRATINGFNLIKEEFEALNAHFLDIVKTPETFNKQDII